MILNVSEGDHRILTIPLLEKIRKLIIETDVIIADITGRNPNVFYELGLADAYDKKIILITQDEIKEAPTDIRHMEFIKYDLSKDIDFISKLDNAFHNLFIHRYIKLYEIAKELLIKFNKSKNLNLEICSIEEFQLRIIVIEKTQGIPDQSTGEFKGFLLPKIIKENSDFEIMKKVLDWITEQNDG